MLREREALIQDLFERAMDIPPSTESLMTLVQEVPENTENTQDEKPTQLNIKREPSQHRPQGVSKSNPHPSTHEQAADIKRREEQARAKKFFNEFLQKANDAQIEIFKAVIESPGVQTIKAFMSIPFIPQMLNELKEKEAKEKAEKINKMQPREFCEWVIKYSNTTAHECLIEYYKNKENQKNIDSKQ